MMETRLRMLIGERLEGAEHKRVPVAQGEITRMITLADAMKASIEEGRYSPAYLALKTVLILILIS